ncbi:VirB4 family type IV secretion system protein [Granulicella mallensis]|uniref:Type IV secretion system protein VirB4 n=1 Tax=Granulicella mallensis TaxID=940614 RepID=A0A7W8EAU8_9BACT|nr:type VI secretion protein [Granulicella mallensis]MBB5064894.1 type IV secretion system protein VirB4 [Granulicella mallensis]
MTHANDAPWFAKAGAATSIVPLSHFVGASIFALKGGGYGCLFSLDGIDPESRTDEDLDVRVRGVEAALRGLPQGACLYQYTRVIAGFDLPRRNKYLDAVTETFAGDRIEFLNETARFRRIDLHWCLTIEPDVSNPLGRKPKEQRNITDRQLYDLEKAATILESHMNDSIGLKLLHKDRVFQFFSYLFNLEEWASDVRLRSDTGVDRQLVHAPVEWHSEYLRIGRRYVQMFPLTNTPEISRPCLFTNLTELDCDSVLCSVWRPQPDNATRKEVTSQEKFLEFFKLSPFQRLMSGRDTEPLEDTASAKAVAGNVDNLTEVVASLDKLGQGDYALRLLLSARTAAELRAATPVVHRLFVDARAPIIEETYGNLSAFYAMFPGNRQFNVYPLWLREDHHARLSSIFAPHLGHPHADDLDAEYLNIFETRTRTPYFQDAYVNGVRVQLIIGPTGTGKSVHANQMLSLEQKYGGFTFIFDIGGSYESVVELYGGRIDRVGKDGPRINPFALEPTEANIAFLHSFIKLLLTNSGATLGPEDDDDVFKSVKGIYNLPRAMRRLGNLTLPKHLDRYLAKWKDQGVYHAVFDNTEDSLQMSRLQCFDFQGVNNKQYADLIEPLMFWILRRIDEIVYDPKNLGVPKHVLIEEIFANMKNKELLESALASIKMVRKNLGGMTMIGQSADDLGENADTIVNSCTSFLFLPDATFNRRVYGELFKLSEQQLDMFESLRPREALYVRRDGITKVITLNLDARSYAKFSTKPKDRVRRSKLVEMYGLHEGIERFAQGETV